MLNVAGLDGAEMPVIEGQNKIRPETFRQSDDRSVRRTEREIAILLDKLDDARSVFLLGSLNIEACEALEKKNLD